MLIDAETAMARSALRCGGGTYLQQLALSEELAVAGARAAAARIERAAHRPAQCPRAEGWLSSDLTVSTSRPPPPPSRWVALHCPPRIRRLRCSPQRLQTQHPSSAETERVRDTPQRTTKQLRPHHTSSLSVTSVRTHISVQLEGGPVGAATLPLPTGASRPHHKSHLSAASLRSMDDHEPMVINLPSAPSAVPPAFNLLDAFNDMSRHVYRQFVLRSAVLRAGFGVLCIEARAQREHAATAAEADGCATPAAAAVNVELKWQ
jgi:hypothetical protein